MHRVPGRDSNAMAWEGTVWIVTVEAATGHHIKKEYYLQQRIDGRFILKPTDNEDVHLIGNDDGLIAKLLTGQLGPRLLREAS